jgi:hypothetical protein
MLAAAWTLAASVVAPVTGLVGAAAPALVSPVVRAAPPVSPLVSVAVPGPDLVPTLALALAAARVLAVAAALVVLLALALAAALLLVPLRLRARLDLGASPGWEARLGWAFGLVRAGARGSIPGRAQTDVTLAGRRIAARQCPGRQRPAAGPRRLRRPKPAGPPDPPRRPRHHAVDAPGLVAAIPAAATAVGRVLRSLRLRLRGRVSCGFEDPCLNAEAWTLATIVPPVRGLAMDVDFVRPGLRGWVEVEARLLPVAVVVAALAALRSRDLRRALRSLRP